MSEADFSTLASCEPAPAYRDRISQDLNIKGMVSCPQKVDMRAIIPVYNFAPPIFNKKTVAVQNYLADLALAGQPGLGTFLLPPVKHYAITLEGLYCQVYLNAAGRAAVVGSDIYILLRFIDGLSGVNYAIGDDRWTIAASAGQPLYLLTSDRTIGMDIVTADIPAPNVQRINWNNKFPIIYHPNNALWILIQYTGGNFPAGTTLDMQTYFSYE